MRDLPDKSKIHSKKNSKVLNGEPNSSFYFEYNERDAAYETGGFNEKLNSKYNQIDNNKVSDFEDSLNYIEEKINEVTESDAGDNPATMREKVS